MTNLVSIDLVAGTAFAYVGHNRVAGGKIDGWNGPADFISRGKLELFRAAPEVFRFHPNVNAYDEGRSAFRRGALRTGNPFPARSPDHERWDDGWQMESDLRHGF